MNSQFSLLKELSIQPDDVVKAWGLCSHLSRAVEFLGCVGRQNSILGNLREAEYHIGLALKDFDDENEGCASLFIKKQPLELETVLNDWQLSFHLREAMSNIRAYRKIPQNIYEFRLLREEVLYQALAHIKAEIKELEDFQL